MGGRAARASPASEPRPAACITGSRAVLLFKPFNGRNTEPGSMPRQPATPPTRRHLLAEQDSSRAGHFAIRASSPGPAPAPHSLAPLGLPPSSPARTGVFGQQEEEELSGFPFAMAPGVVAPGVLVPTETTQHTLLVLTRAVQTQPVLSAFPAPLAFGVGVLLLGKTCGCSSVSPPARAKCLRGQPQSTLINPANILDLSYSTAS